MNTNSLLNQSLRKLVFLIILVPIIIQLILINLVQNSSDEKMYYLTFLFFGLLYMPYFYWLYVAVSFLYTHSNEYFKLKFKNFKISLAINLIVILNFVFFVAYMFRFIFKGGEPNDKVLSIIIFIQIIGICSFFYTSYFICKLITTIELKKKVYFNEIAGNLVVFSFPPIALWIIHNKIKKIQFDKVK